MCTCSIRLFYYSNGLWCIFEMLVLHCFLFVAMHWYNLQTLACSSKLNTSRMLMSLQVLLPPVYFPRKCRRRNYCLLWLLYRIIYNLNNNSFCVHLYWSYVFVCGWCVCVCVYRSAQLTVDWDISVKKFSPLNFCQSPSTVKIKPLKLFLPQINRCVLCNYDCIYIRV